VPNWDDVKSLTKDEREALKRVETARRRKHAEVDLSQLKITDLPPQLAELTDLVELDVLGTLLTRLPPCLRPLRNLRHLSAIGCKLEELPAWIGELSALENLYLGLTGLSGLPDSIVNLEKLRFLDLTDATFTKFPPQLRQLKSLRILRLMSTPVTELPEWIGELSQLGMLDLTGTKITQLPASLARLSRLHQLDPPAGLVEPPPEIVAQGLGAILAYLRSLEDENGGEEQWRCKIVVAGEAKSGKTSLVKALLKQPHDAAEPMTHGVNISELCLPHPTREGVTMRLAAWDFGGQRTYRSAHRFYMTDQSLFLLLFNCREEWDDRQMREWLKAISARAGSSPILLVGTNAREHRHGLPIATLRSDFPQIVPQVFYVDCEPSPDRLGIDELRTAIAEHAAALPLMGQRWPKTWLDAAEAIVELPGNHAPLVAVDDAMQRAGLADSVSRSTLLAALHYRGEVLHFADEPEIADTVVLHPSWVDGHVTKILDSADVHAREGLLSRSELQKAWPQTDPALRSHLIGLMEAFDLAYRVDSTNHDDLCLIVDRLPHDPPDYGAMWAAARDAVGADELRLVIGFGGPVLLAGIPTWFIAREHRFTVNKHWRYGALLYDRFDSGCHALVIADDNKGTVELTVRGVAPVGFMSVLKDGLLSPLRQRYPYLNWTVNVPCPCQEDSGGQCSHVFEESYLKKVVARKRLTVECQRTSDEVPVERLMYGLRAASQTLLAEDIRSIKESVKKVTGLQLQTFDYQRTISEIQNAQADLCPSVFTLTRRPKKLHFGTEYTLRLFCEQPGAWHPLERGRGIFTFGNKPEWLNACAPYLRVLLPILQHALPLIGPAIGVTKALIGPEPAAAQEYVAELWSDERLAEELEIMKEVVDTLPKVIGEESPAAAQLSGELAFGDHAPLRRAYDLADFRALRRSLDAIAPPGSDPWGGLAPMVTPEGKAVFVCEYHAKQYRYPRET